MPTRKNFPNRKDQRREAAKARQAEYDALSKDEKVQRATDRGGKRELARLNK